MYSFQYTAILLGIVVTSCVVSAQFNEPPKPFPETPPVIRESLVIVELPTKLVDFFKQKGKQPTQFVDEAKKKTQPGKYPVNIPDEIVQAPLTPDSEPIVPPPQGGTQNAVQSSIIIVPDLECEEGFAFDDNGKCRELW